MLNKDEEAFVLGPCDDVIAFDSFVNDVECLIDEAKEVFLHTNDVDIVGEAEASFGKIKGVVERLLKIQDITPVEEE